MNEKNVKRDFIFILILVIVSFFIKTYNIHASIWFDESHTIFYGQQNLNELIEYLKQDTNPPFYYIIVHYLIKIFGISLESIRYFSVACSILSICLLYFILKKHFNAFVAIFSSVLLTLINTQVYYAQEARNFAFSQLLIVILIYLIFKLLKAPKISTALLIAFVNTIMFYTHFVVSFAVISMFIFVLINKNKQAIKYYIISCIISILFFSPWLKHIIKTAKRNNQDFWLTKPNINTLIQSISELFMKKEIALLYFAILLIGLVVLILRKEKYSLNIKALMLFVLLFFVPIIVSYVLAITITPIFLTRYFIYSMIGICVAVVIIIDTLVNNKYLKIILALILVGINIRYLNLRESKHENWILINNYIKQFDMKNTVILLSPRHYDITFTYYFSPEDFKDYKKPSNFCAYCNASIARISDLNSLEFEFKSLKKSKSIKNIIFIDSDSNEDCQKVLAKLKEDYKFQSLYYADWVKYYTFLVK
jgi:uncharacterized membrane protein